MSPLSFNVSDFQSSQSSKREGDIDSGLVLTNMSTFKDLAASNNISYLFISWQLLEGDKKQIIFSLNGNLLVSYGQKASKL